MAKTGFRVVRIVAIVLAFVVAFALLNMVAKPKYSVDLPEGSMIAEYYHSSKNHQVIFIGDCDVYQNFSPMAMYEQAGIKAFVRGTPHQFIWQSYYILRETLRHETPDVVVFSIHSIRYEQHDFREISQSQREAYNRLTLDNMRWSRDKVDLIRSSMTEEESFASYIFPILRYNARFGELGLEDFTQIFTRQSHTFNGFLPATNVTPLGNLPAKRTLDDYNFCEENMRYLERMAKLTYENNVRLVLVMPPRMFPHWHEEYNAQIEAFANDHPNVSYYNLLDKVDEIGIDFAVDTHNGGLNLNWDGATKLSRFFAELLAENYSLDDLSGDEFFDELFETYQDARALPR